MVDSDPPADPGTDPPLFSPEQERFIRGLITAAPTAHPGAVIPPAASSVDPPPSLPPTGSVADPLGTLSSSATPPLPTFTKTSTTPATALATLTTAVTGAQVIPPLHSVDPTQLAMPNVPLPPKLIRKILDLDYVEMSELVPDSWRPADEETKCCHVPRRPRRGPVTNILLWLDCYSTLATVLISKYPDKASELWAYQRTIIVAQRDFDGDSWVTYDSCYRRQAANKKSLDWSRLDFGLYNQAFAGRAKIENRCKLCLSEFHTSSECHLAPEQRRPGPSESGNYISLSNSRQPSSGSSRQSASSIEICKLYNSEKGNLCRYSRCRYAHVCLNWWCHGPHPRPECSSQKGDFRKRPRSPQAPTRSS